MHIIFKVFLHLFNFFYKYLANSWVHKGKNAPPERIKYIMAC